MSSAELVPLVPQSLSHLPVAKQIGAIDFDAHRFICRASTGTGKSVCLAPYEVTLRKARGESAVVLMRQPTKLTVQYIQSALTAFWPTLTIGVCTADEKRSIEEADIIVISDGSLGGALERLKDTGKTLIYYVDEAHAPLDISEIEWGIAKKLGLRMRFLSATVDAESLVAYLGGDVPVYDLEGRVFPIEKDIEIASHLIFDRDDHDELVSRLEEHITEARFDDDGILVFVPTRRMAETLAAKFDGELPTKFAHGGVHPAELEKWTEERQGQAFAVFATTAAAMGITIGNVNRVVVCDEVVDSEAKLGVERQFSSPMPDNLLLQAIGRTGRLRPGKATLLTKSTVTWDLRTERDWDDVRPRPIVGPCSKKTPFNVILTMASYGIRRDSDIDLYSKLDPKEMAHARAELVAMRCLSPEGDLLPLGRVIQATPLEPHVAHLVHTAPSRMAKLCALAAVILSERGTYQLVGIKPRTREYEAATAADPDWQILPRACVHQGSAPMTLAHLLARAAQAKEDGDLARWARANNLNERTVSFALYDFAKAGETVCDDPVDALAAIDFDDHDLDLAVDGHVSKHRLLTRAWLDGSWGRIRLGGQSMGMTIDSVMLAAWGLGHYGGWVAGIPKVIKSNKGTEFASLNLPILLGA